VALGANPATIQSRPATAKPVSVNVEACSRNWARTASLWFIRTFCRA
jgi:hypothetical protein